MDGLVAVVKAGGTCGAADPREAALSRGVAPLGRRTDVGLSFRLSSFSARFGAPAGRVCLAWLAVAPPHGFVSECCATGPAAILSRDEAEFYLFWNSPGASSWVLRETTGFPLLDHGTKKHTRSNRLVQTTACHIFENIKNEPRNKKKISIGMRKSFHPLTE